MSTRMLIGTKHPNVPFVDLGAQYRTIETEINQAIAKVIRETDFILGRELHLFEEESAAFCDAHHAIGVDSGTSALELALRAFDIGPGDEVITAANSFIASPGPSRYWWTSIRTTTCSSGPGSKKRKSAASPTWTSG